MQALSSKYRSLDSQILDRRINKEEAIKLLKNTDLLELAHMAYEKRKKEIHPENIVTFCIDRNINYTNVCINECKFCAFYRKKGEPGAYIISDEELFNKIKEAVELGATSILIQGGLHPDIDLKFIVNMFRKIKEWFPQIHIHGLSPPEINYLAKREGISIKETLIRLMESGLGSIPGGGAEILSDRTRNLISPKKCSKDTWLNVMREAHKLGIKTTATMMFGSLETEEEIVEHMSNIRKLQDETGGFTAFIPWVFQPKNTKLSYIEKATSAYYLRILALSRIFLDNIKNIQVSWVTQGKDIAQIALFFGANDFGSLMIEENVVKAAGVHYRIGLEEILDTIKSAGFIPAQRNTLYEILKVYDKPDS